MCILASIALVTSSFLTIGASFHYLYYVRRRSREGEWRLQQGQPFWGWDDIRGKLPLALLNMLIFGGLVGLGTWLVLTGRSKVFWGSSEYGPATLVLGSIAPYLIFHVVTYYVHRFLHTRTAFRLIHSVHHRNRAPMFMDAQCSHPLESVYSATALFLPAFVVPIWAPAFLAYFFIVGIHELVDHTGVSLHVWPFSATAAHDQHHRSVRVCYGQLFDWLDRLHGTSERAPSPTEEADQ